MKGYQAKKLKELGMENARLKRLLAESELDKAILKEAASSGNFLARRSDDAEWTMFATLWAERRYPSAVPAGCPCPCKYGAVTFHSASHAACPS